MVGQATESVDALSHDARPSVVFGGLADRLLFARLSAGLGAPPPPAPDD